MTGRFILKGTIAEVSNAVKKMAEEEEPQDKEANDQLDDTFKTIINTFFGF